MARAGTLPYTSIRVKFSRVSRSAWNALTSRSSKKKSGQDEEEDGMLDYDSPENSPKIQ